MFLLFLLIVDLLFAIASMTIMDMKGRSAALGFFLGLLLGPFALPICAAYSPSVEVSALRFAERLLREERGRGARRVHHSTG